MSKNIKNIPCNICGSVDCRLLFKVKDLNYRTTDEEFNIVKCRGCGLVYVNPQPKEMGRYYPPAYGPHSPDPKVSIKEPLRKTLELFYNYRAAGKADAAGITDKLRYLPRFFEIKLKDDFFFFRIPYGEDKRILDVGCGNGSYLLRLKKLGWNAAQLYGVDLPGENLKRLREAEGINITEGDFLNAPLPPDFFDFVTLNHVLEHFGDPLAAMKKAYKIVKPGGKVLIGIPNFKSVEALFIFKEKWYHLDPPRHLYHFAPKTLKRLLEGAGFTVEKMYFKKCVGRFTMNLKNYGWNVSKSTEKYAISNMLKLFKLFGFSGELLCIAVKKAGSK